MAEIFYHTFDPVYDAIIARADTRFVPVREVARAGHGHPKPLLESALHIFSSPVLPQSIDEEKLL